MTVTLAPTATRYQYPTLIPTIEPTKILGLLKSSFSLQTLNGLNGHSIKRITGWSNGFNGGSWSDYHGYLWMDTSHLLLFPATGEIQEPNWTTINASSVVMNINTGISWLPPNDLLLEDNRSLRILLPRWSSKLGVLITAETLRQKNGVSTYNADGKCLAHYDGKLIDVSPSAERIFIVGDTWVDLKSGRKVNFGWGPGLGDDVQRWLPIWSRDENQIFFCCYYYGNAKTGKNYTITNEKTIFDGGPFVNMHSLRHAYGVWLNDHVVMPQYDAWWYEGPDFSTIFNVAERTYHNLGVVADLPDAFNNHTYAYKSISPNGDYMYISPGAQSEKDPQIYLVDLKTLKSQLLHVGSLDWSANGKYALAGSQVLTLLNKTLRPLPVQPDSEKLFFSITDAWHPTAGAYVEIDADKQQHQFLYLLDVEALTYQHLDLPSSFDGMSTQIAWSPKGDHLAMAASDGSLWQIDYPKMENLEQLSSPMANVKDISWSPDSRYLSFAGGTDIYIVDTESTP